MFNREYYAPPNKYTGEKLSRWLLKKGFKKSFDYTHKEQRPLRSDYKNYYYHDKAVREFNSRVSWEAPAYDTLNELCIDYSEEIWGDDCPKNGETGYVLPKSTGHSMNVLDLLRRNKKEEAERYIMKHSILNKK